MQPLLSILLLFIPIYIQIKYGNRRIWGYIETKFTKICLISILSQIIVVFLGFMAYFPDNEKQGLCFDPGPFTIVILSIPFSIILLIIMIIQGIIIIRKR